EIVAAILRRDECGLKRRFALLTRHQSTTVTLRRERILHARASKGDGPAVAASGPIILRGPRKKERGHLRMTALERRSWPLRSARAHGALVLGEREVLAADRKPRRRLRQVDGIDHALDLGRHRDRLAAGILSGDRHRVVAVGPLHAVGALAVPGEILRAGL